MEEETGRGGKGQKISESDLAPESSLAGDRQLLLAKLAGRFAGQFYDLIKTAQNLDLNATDPEPAIAQFCRANEITRDEFSVLQWADLSRLSPPPLI